MKIAIVGAAYTGLATLQYLKDHGHELSVTTTRADRAGELEKLADRVVVMKGSDRDKMRSLIAGQDVVLLTMAGGMVERDGKFVMDLDLYRDAYVGTAQSLADVIDTAPSVGQIVFTGSWSAYGNAGGADDVNEDTPATPGSPFAQVFVDTENLLFGLETRDRRVCVYRTGTIYGPQVGYVPRGLEAQTVPMAGLSVPFDGNAPAAIVHRDDVVKAVVFAIERRLSGLYNLINDVSEKKESYYKKITDAAGVAPINWVAPGSGPKSLSNRKIKDAGFVFGDPDATRDGESFL